MAFKYNWKRREANFAAPVEAEFSGGTHIAAECILKFGDKYVALRRPQAIPEHEIPEKALKITKACLYNVHGLPIWGETTDQFISRIVKEQTGVNVKSFKVADMSMGVYEKTQQWYIEPAFLVDIDRLPELGMYGNEVTEVILFQKDTVPNDFGWWTKDQIERFLRTYDP